MNGRFIVAMARREARASGRRLALYGSCMALGIASLVGVHGLRTSVSDNVSAQAQRLLGADLRLTSRAPFEPEVEATVAGLTEAAGTASARITRFGSMALAEASGRTRLADINGIDGPYPLYGEIRTEPPGLYERLAGSEPVALVDSSLLIQLDATVGDHLLLGLGRFQVIGTITRAPGTFGLRTQMAPRVFIGGQHVEATGLIQPGSLVSYLLFLSAPEALLEPWIKTERSAIAAARVGVETVEEYQESLDQSFGVLTRYLGLVGLAALALGGIGVAAGVRVFVREKLDSVAVLRSLGAQSRDVLACYGLLALLLGGVAGCVGSGLGVGVQLLLPRLVAGLLPVQVQSGIDVASIVTGVGLGLWLATLFAAGPLLDLGRVPPLRALRRDFVAAPGPQRGRALLIFALGVSLLAASLWQAPSPLVGLSFAGGLAAVLTLLAGAAAAAAAGLRKLRLRGAPYWLRQGIANLFRPRNHTLATTLAIGFGLFLVSTLHAVQFNVRQQFAIDTGSDRPNLILFDVQPDQVAEVEGLLEERGALISDRAHLISARLAGVGGREAADWLLDETLDKNFRWALRREYRLTYSDVQRDSELIVAGSWWQPADGAREEPVPVSLEAGIAEALGVRVGDRVSWDIQGVRVESSVWSLREVDWGRFATNFFVTFPNGVLEEAPQSTVLVARLDDANARAELQRDLVGLFPNVSALDATVILNALDAMRREMNKAVRLMAALTLATGLVILIAAAATARTERRREGLLLRTMGASSQMVRRVMTTEAVALAALAVAVGTGLSIVAAWATVRFVFELPFDPPAIPLLALAAATLLVGSVLGAGGRADAHRRPLAALREAEQTGAA